MPAQLLALSEGPNILLDKPIILFGRHPECDIQLNSRKVSRRHCCIAQVHDYLVIRDLGSTNGIRINGQRVPEGKLASGDEVTIGNFRYQVCWDTIDAPVPTPRDPVLHGIKAPPPPPAQATLDDSYLEDADEPVPLEGLPSDKVRAASPVTPPPGMVKRNSDSSIMPGGFSLAPRTDVPPPK